MRLSGLGWRNALCETGFVLRDAQAIGLTQPAVTQLLADLERLEEGARLGPVFRVRLWLNVDF